ncbi:M48 family metallopeptidase [Pseudorhodoplanes sp.]|uniref:M48 family metallopeptidase n=1 Tax=Pseudorhodoplanes sp. TaxID=1934341 RepID=UPI002D060487|nr:M48 family metallopeptidase [Pseudorhodoplanes sp.]HWV41570.1 M48 family metallopeptidase [Pseudorhodoplanes sp.]
MPDLTSPAVYFDGMTAARHDVTVELNDYAVVIFDRAGELIDQWPYPRLKHLSAPAHIFRIGLRKSPTLARLEIADQDMAHAIDLACPDIDRTGVSARKARRKAIALSFMAAVSLLAVAVYGVPAIADRLAPAIPQGVERRLGNAADTQVRAMLNKGPSNRPFECGGAAVEQAGHAAFNKLMTRLQDAAELRLPLRAAVIRREEANAIALPGGHVYVFKGLIDQAENVDEVAGVIAHELGHVANRDGARAVLQGAGLSLIFGMFLGDFVGGGAVVLAGKTLLKSAYSRHAESRADAFAVRTMDTAGGDARALGRFLARIAGKTRSGSIFLDHPATPERVTQIDAMAPPQSRGATLLDAAEWRALKRICAGYG